MDGEESLRGQGHHDPVGVDDQGVGQEQQDLAGGRGEGHLVLLQQRQQQLLRQRQAIHHGQHGHVDDAGSKVAHV